MNAKPIGTIAPTALSATRIELHWLAQVLGATADAFCERAPDDSQSNLEWDHDRSALVGHPIGSGAQIGLRIRSAELVVFSGADVVAEMPARGETLAALLSWAGDAIASAAGVEAKSPLAVRDYDMPDHSVSAKEPFTLASLDSLAEIERWFAAATSWLSVVPPIESRASEVRCWPHHFDIGGIVMLEPDKPFEEARQIGFGWSPGDSSYDEPYFYITPFPVPDKLPELAAGHWHREGFTGAILTGTAVAKSDAQPALVEDYLRTTLESLRPLVEE